MADDTIMVANSAGMDNTEDIDGDALSRSRSDIDDNSRGLLEIMYRL